MDTDRLARTLHRRGALAALASLFAAPAVASAQSFPRLRCSPRGGGCTLHVDCCGRTLCYREPLNPNSGVCGGVVRDETVMPIASTGGGTSGGGQSLDEVGQRIDRLGNNNGDVDCCDFPDQAAAQRAHLANPGNTWRLDGGRGDGVACNGIDYDTDCP